MAEKKTGKELENRVAEAYRALRGLLMGAPQAGLEAARRARELAEEDARTVYPVEADIIRAEWLIGWALLDLAAEEADRREEHLAEAEGHLTAYEQVTLPPGGERAPYCLPCQLVAARAVAILQGKGA